VGGTSQGWQDSHYQSRQRRRHRYVSLEGDSCSLCAVVCSLLKTEAAFFRCRGIQAQLDATAELPGGQEFEQEVAQAQSVPDQLRAAAAKRRPSVSGCLSRLDFLRPFPCLQERSLRRPRRTLMQQSVRRGKHTHGMAAGTGPERQELTGPSTCGRWQARYSAKRAIPMAGSTWRTVGLPTLPQIYIHQPSAERF